MDAGPPQSDTSRPGLVPGESEVSGDVRLEVPAEARFARVVRVAVSAVAVRRGIDVAVIEDLRIAIDESLILLLRGSVGDEGPEAGAASLHDHSVVVTIADGASELRVDLQLQPPPAGGLDSRDDVDALSRFTELVPPRVKVLTVDPTTGLVRLGLA